MSPKQVVLFSAGSNARGQLAHGTVDDSHHFLRCTFDTDYDDPLSNGISSISLAFGANHTLILLRDEKDVSTVWACGDGMKGQIGEEHRSNTSPSTSFRRIDFERPLGYEYSIIAACWETSFICLAHPEKRDVLLSLGADDYGDKGIGGPRATTSQEPVSTVDFEHLFEEDDLPDSMKILDIRVGVHHLLIKLICQRRDGSSRTFFAGWGASRHGQLGPTCSSPFEPTPVAVPVPVAHDVVSFAVGNHHSVFVYSSGRVLAYGSNRKKQTQGLDSIEDACVVDATWNGSYVLRGSRSAKWRIYAAGSNSKGQLAFPPSDATACEVTFREDSAVQGAACGSEHTLVHLRPNPSNSIEGDSEDEVWGWGWNEHGNLGLGHCDDIHAPTLIWPNENCIVPSHKVFGVWAGFGTTWIAIEYMI